MKVTNIIQRISGKDPRSALLLKNVLASLAVKGWSVVVQLLLVPLTLACLGVYENGVWLTISSVLLWIDNLDVGLGNGLRNKLAVCLAENNIEKARQMVSSTIAMLTCIIVPVTIVLLIAECVGDVYAFLNVSPQRIGNLVTILLASTIMVCATFILKFLGNFYMGLQLPAINNAIVTGGNTLALIGTGLVYLSGRHSLLERYYRRLRQARLCMDTPSQPHTEQNNAGHSTTDRAYDNRLATGLSYMDRHQSISALLNDGSCRPI